ncbi:AAA family ATPase [Vibrio cholerae]|nr:AAA family ATPase [Vibrio cholerae]EKF9814147.1 AAA family ATPase [Vibrio cholerae]
MEIKSFRIKSFRTITTEQEILLDRELTLVGPNNSGKTNVLLSMLAFFTGYDNEYEYSPERDLPYNQDNVKTSITCTFSGLYEGDDKDIFDKLYRLREMLAVETIEDKKTEFSINVYFNGRKPVYQIYPGVKRPKDKQAQFSLLQKSFISSVLDRFHWYYIPSNKSIEYLYEELVTPLVRRNIAAVLEKYDSEIKNSITNLTKSMNLILSKNGISDVEISMDYPNKLMENFISGLDLYVKDANNSSIFEKGLGIQSAVFLSSFKWITNQQKGKTVLWLIEEPETFMHPSLAEKCSKVFEELAEIANVVKTTHSINFIPSSINRVQGVSLGKEKNTIIHPYETHVTATESIRKSLGVKFSDFFGLSSMNVFLEGETDRLYIERILKFCNEHNLSHFPLLRSGNVQLRDFTGVSDLKGFVKANLDLMRNEVGIVCLFDGDDAGLKAIKELSGFFGKKGGFNANKDYVLIPEGMAIESIFPHEWIVEAWMQENSWFEHWITSSGNQVEFFSIRDKSKKAYMNFIFDKIGQQTDEQWMNKIITLLNDVEASMLVQAKKI